MANNHEAARCGGCDQVLDLDTLTELLGASTHTLYKWAAAGYPAFPRRLCLPNRRIAVTCKATKAWMQEVTR
jgi:predicted DNA-binding transcriptional regulator AlpA